MGSAASRSANAGFYSSYNKSNILEESSVKTGKVSETDKTRGTSSAHTDAHKTQSQTKYDEYCSKKLSRIRQSSSIMNADKFSFSNTALLGCILSELLYMHDVYFDVQKYFERQEYERFQRTFCDVILETDQLKLYEKVLDEVPKTVDFGDADQQQIVTLALVMGLLHNCTDLSDPFAEATAKSSIVEHVKTMLDVNRGMFLQNQCEETTDQIIRNCHGVLHNTSMREANLNRLRDLELLPTLQPYLEAFGQMVRISTLATLANIVTEEECDVIKAHAQVVEQLLAMLQIGCDDAERRCHGWSCKECVLAVRQLARNDANKKLLVELNTLPVLVRVANTGDDEEKRESVHAILQLSFDDDARKQIAQDPDSSVLHLLVQLKDGSDRDTADLCVKALWNLREELQKSKEEAFRKLAEKLFGHTTTDPNKSQHIMISYQSANRDFLVKIKEKIKTKGYKVWMDVEQMSGDILETMARGVENAAIVLICFSRKYKESDFCRQEAQYAHKLKKAVIPLKMEDGYEPDGWLGFMLASEYFVNFSGKYLAPPKTEEKIQDLFRQIEKKWTAGMDVVDTAVIVKETRAVVAPARPDNFASHGNISSVSGIETGPQNRPKFSKIRKWTKDDVKNWLKKNNLENYGLGDITGAEIALLTRMLLEAPDQLYKCLRHDLQIKTLVAKANFVWALEDLIESDLD